MATTRLHESKALRLVSFCSVPRTSSEMMEHIGLTNKRSFRSNYLIPLQEAGLIRKTIPDLPTSRHQKYVSSCSKIATAFE